MQLSGLLPGLEQNSISCSGLAGTFITRGLSKAVGEGSRYLPCPKQLRLQGDWDTPCNWLRLIISSLWIKTETEPCQKKTKKKKNPALSHRDSETREKQRKAYPALGHKRFWWARGELEREMRDHLNKQGRPVWKGHDCPRGRKLWKGGVSLALLCSAEQPFTHRPQLSCSASSGEKGIKVKKAGPSYWHEVFK